MSPKYSLIAVLIPTRGLIFTKTQMALIRELTPYDHAYFYTYDLPIPDCRNALVEAAKKSEIVFTHYLMIDDDVILPEGGLKAMLEANVDVAVIDYPTHWMGKGANTGTAVYSGEELLFAGLGCVLVKADAQAKLPPFRRGGRYMDVDKKGRKVLYGEQVNNDGGEDFEWFQDAKNAGLTIKMIPNLVAGHAKVMKHIGVITPGKYISQHDIHVADRIDKPLK